MNNMSKAMINPNSALKQCDYWSLTMIQVTLHVTPKTQAAWMRGRGLDPPIVQRPARVQRDKLPSVSPCAREKARRLVP
jgi:hypothetical protein